jgi:tetratricopeptide (TPR) repeat protein
MTKRRSPLATRRPAKPSPREKSKRRGWWLSGTALILIAAAVIAWWYAAPRIPAAREWQVARAAVADDDFEGARRALAICQKLQPRNPETYILLARVERRAGDPRKAQDWLREARQAGAPADQVDFEQMLLAACSGAIRELAPRLRAIIEGDASRAELASEALVQGLIQARAIDEAHLACDARVHRYPEDWRARYWMGWLLEAEGFGTLAVAEYRKAADINPGNLGVRIRLAESLLNNSEYPLALPELEWCRKTSPDDPAIRFAMARCLQALGKNEEAEPLLQQVISENARHGPALLLLARTRLDREDTAGAVDFARRSAMLDPSNPMAAATLAEALRGVQSEEASVWEEKARTLTEQNERVASLTRDARYHARDVEIRYQLGTLLLSMGRQAEAVSWFQRGLAIDPNHQPTRDALARLAESAGRPDSRVKNPSAREP